MIDSCALCVGNSDKKFTPLVKQRKGIFTNTSGKLEIEIHNNYDSVSQVIMWIPELMCCLQWLLDVFLKYLDNLEKSVEKREGFAKEEKNLMILSHETRLGLRITGEDNSVYNAYMIFFIFSAFIHRIS